MDNDNFEQTMDSTSQPPIDPTRSLTNTFRELSGLLKNGDVVEILTVRGVNASVALLAVEALAEYISGKFEDAYEDFDEVANEIKTRLESRNK